MAYVLDSSAALAVLLGERHGQAVVEVIERVHARREQVLLPFMTVMEVHYRLLRMGQENAEVGLGLLRSWPVRVIESTPVWGAAAARLKARGGLSLADAWIASLALLYDAELVHKDPEFDRVEGLRSYPLR